MLGVESGATRTVALLEECDPVSQEGIRVKEMRLGPANLRLLDDRQLEDHFRRIARAWPVVDAAAIGMAGARTEADRRRIRRAAARAWPGVPCHATNDLETALAAADPVAVFGRPAEGRRQARRSQATNSKTTRVLILSGTGSCCFGRSANGRTAKVGGWGHILGDKGSGFEIGLRALKAAVYYLDRDGEWSGLGRRLLRKLALNEPEDLIGWVQTAGKEDTAALAPEVFSAGSAGEAIAADILSGAAHSLAGDAVSCARRLAKPGAPVQFVLSGGVLLGQPRFARRVAALLRKSWPGAVVTPLRRESVWGAVALARSEFEKNGVKSRAPAAAAAGSRDADVGAAGPRTGEGTLDLLPSLRHSPTEQRNPRSMNLDRMSIAEAVVLMLSEDEKIPRALLAERKRIGTAVEWVARTFRRGGGLFYVGAGTSGRLGVLDASECPPTFRTPPEQVQGIIAGGRRALWESVEGAEDDPGAGARAVEFRGVGRKDVVAGIAASGRTPFVRGALIEARRRGAKTILICFNPRLEIPRSGPPDLLIAPDVGPEILTGSTRLKCGTATKLILNILTTLAMVRAGKVVSNLMIDLNPSNMKLRDRAIRIVRELTGADAAGAEQALEKSGWVVKGALKRMRWKGGRVGFRRV